MCTNNIWRPCFQFFGVHSQNVLFTINLIISKWLARQNAPVFAVFSLQYCSWQRGGCFCLARRLLWAKSAGASEGGTRLEEEEGHRPLFYSLSIPCLLSVQCSPASFFIPPLLFTKGRNWIHFAIFLSQSQLPVLSQRQRTQKASTLSSEVWAEPEELSPGAAPQASADHCLLEDFFHGGLFQAAQLISWSFLFL